MPVLYKFDFSVDAAVSKKSCFRDTITPCGTDQGHVVYTFPNCWHTLRKLMPLLLLDIIKFLACSDILLKQGRYKIYLCYYVYL